MATGSGIISVTFLNYYNGEALDSNGDCCDFLCGTCDHYFVICIDDPNGYVFSIDRCIFGKKTTGYIEQNVITFGPSIAGEKSN